MLYVAIVQLPPADSSAAPTVSVYDTPDKPHRHIGDVRLPRMESKESQTLTAVLDAAKDKLRGQLRVRLINNWTADKLGTGKYVGLVSGPSSL